MTPREKFRLYQYYVLIAVISLICLFVLPFMGSTVGLAFNIPNTVAGWVVFVVGNLTTALLALLIFHCFIKQAKINIREDKHFIEAQEILMKSKDKKYHPKSPRRYLSEQYSRKGITLFLSSLLAMIGLSNAALNFDLVILLSFVIVVFNSIVFGFIEMRAVEDYWTSEYWLYAKEVQEQEKEKAERLAAEAKEAANKEKEKTK